MNTVVLGVLGGLLLLGHHYDWRFPGSVTEAREAPAPRRPATPSPTASNQPSEPHGAELRLASNAALGKAGVKTCAVEALALPDFVTAPGSLQYNRTRLAQLAPR